MGVELERSVPARRLLSPRDEQIIRCAEELVATTPRVTFGVACEALKAATEEAIPGGMVFYLGQNHGRLIVGSLISGVGIMERESGVFVVQTKGIVGPMFCFGATSAAGELAV